MSKWDKLIEKICGLSREVRFEEVKRILESYGYEMKRPRSGGSHCTFRKTGCAPITIPMHEPIKTAYLLLVRDVIESEATNGEND